MDEIALVERFRSEIGPADELACARVRERIQAVITAERTRRRGGHRWFHRRGRVALLAAALAAVGTGAAIGGTSWLGGEPAPPSVVSDFGLYTPQLGFHPEPGRAVLVASDGDIRMYATVNKEGGICVLTEVPWLSASDGGTCGNAAAATARLSAGISHISPELSGKVTFALTGHTSAREARTVRFAVAERTVAERAVGVGGYFVAGLRLRFPASCGGQAADFGTVAVLDGSGHELASSEFEFGRGMTPQGPRRLCASPD